MPRKASGWLSFILESASAAYGADSESLRKKSGRLTRLRQPFQGARQLLNVQRQDSLYSGMPISVLADRESSV